MRKDMIKMSAKIIICLFMVGCATPKIILQTEPPQAEVLLSINGRPEKVKAGVSPLEITETQINEMLKITSESTQWIEITLEKKDFQNKVIAIPSNRWGEMSKTMKVQMQPMDDNTTTVTKVLKYFFNAKKFAETKQYEQAHSEVDKILLVDSKMIQAINMKAGIYFLQGNMNESKALYKKSLEIDPGSNEAIQMLEKIQNKAEGSSTQ